MRDGNTPSQSAKSIEEKLAEFAAEAPAAEHEELPSVLAAQHDQYLYGWANNF